MTRADLEPASGPRVSDPPWRTVAGPVTTVLLTVGAQVLLVPLWVVAAMSLGRYDSSGQGGPFRACTADSVSCDGPVLWLFGLCVLVQLGVCALVARTGARVAGPSARFGFAAHLAGSVVVALLAVLVLALRAGLLG